VALAGDGGLDGAVALVIDDVTDLVRLAGDFDTEHSHLEAVADGVGVVLWEMDPVSCTITAINRAALDVTGWRDVVFLGTPFAWPQRVADVDRERVVAWLRTLTPGADATTIDYRWPGADGRERWLRTRARQTHEGHARVLGVTTDVTAERQRDQLRLDALMTTAGGVAHVVNNCLTAVIGGIELYALGAGGLARTPELEAALEATRKAATMASRLLAFAGRQRLLVETLRLGDVVHERLPGLVATAGTRTLAVDVAPAAWSCRVDRRLLGSALDALLQNACDATPDGGVVRITTRNVPAYAVPGDPDARDGDWVELDVADDGAGMSDEVRRRALEPFFSTRDLADASGLGLSMVYGFVAQSAGHVRLESAPGRGTTVRLRFPRVVAEAPVPGRPATRALVVEDDDNVRVVTAAMLQALGCRVLQAASAGEALAVVAKDHVDVLVCDVVLGHGVDGVMLARTLLDRQPSLAVVLVSGFPRTSFDLAALPPGVLFLTKPLGMAALGEALGVARRERA
jgi:signal transduction histidine kinase